MRRTSPDCAARGALCAGLLALLVAVPSAPTFAAKRQPPVAAATADKPVSRQGTVRYYLRHAGSASVLATVDLDWRIDGRRYEMRSVAETVGLLGALKPTRAVQESRGDIGADGLRPLSFRHERKKNKIDSAQFDWASGEVSYRDQRQPLPAGTQDPLSLYAQLAWLAPRSGALEIPVATGSKLAIYRLTVAGDEPLAGKPAVRVRALTEDEQIDFWLPLPSGTGSGVRVFPAEMPLPLRVRVTDKHGVSIEQSLDAPEH